MNINTKKKNALSFLEITDDKYDVIFADPPYDFKRIGEIHDPRHHNVRPELYARWTESLLATIEKYDRRFDENVRAAWHKALQPGLDRFIELYSVSVPG